MIPGWTTLGVQREVRAFDWKAAFRDASLPTRRRTILDSHATRY